LFEYKISSPTGPGATSLAASDALSLPFRDCSFDGTIVAFGIRNFADRPLALREMFRVLKPGGTSVILELTMPGSAIAAGLYRMHARIVLPVVGRIISGDRSAYGYLPESIADFPRSEAFVRMMGEAGFVESNSTPLSFGAATIFHGRKP